MEKKKNNAVEKAENIAKNNEASTTHSAKKNNSGNRVKHTESHSEKQNKQADYKNAGARLKAEKKKELLQKKQEKRKEALRKKEEKKANKEHIRLEREKVLAEKRIERARLKAHRKAERDKAKATALREKNRHIAELKAKKAQIKADRLARREMLKHESKNQRQKRIAMERDAKRKQKEYRLKEKRERRAEQNNAKHLKREQKIRERQKNKDRRKGFGGYIAAVVSLSVATLVLASVLTFTFLMPAPSDLSLEASYQKSFYDTVNQVDNIDLNLSKILSTKDRGAVQKYLVDTAINSELAENDIQQLPLRDESKFYTTKLINQIGDYSKYLNNKLVGGGELSAVDRENLTQLYSANLTLKEALQKMMDGMTADYSFTKMMDNSEDVVLSNFNELENLSVKYPELIYDGPFSDGQDKRVIKGLPEEEITCEQARINFIKIFGDYSLNDIECTGECNGDITCYNVAGEKDGKQLFAQISVRGGKLIMFDYAGDCGNIKINRETAIRSAEEFVSSLGIEGMKAVWINFANNVYTINFAFTEGDVIVYSDLIKIRVCAETGLVIGFEGKSYYTNHCDREIGGVALTKDQAEEKLSENIAVVATRLALVPHGLDSEILCYEFFGTNDGQQYYIYIDAVTGRQIEMFKVVLSSEGSLLM